MTSGPVAKKFGVLDDLQKALNGDRRLAMICRGIRRTKEWIR